MILLERLEDFNMSVSNFCACFHLEFIKFTQLSGDSFSHNFSNDQYRTVLGTRTVLWTAKKFCGEYSP